MSVRESEPSEVLARARRAWLPEAGAAARVRCGLDVKLATSATVVSSAAAVWPRLLLAGAVAAAAGGAGYWAGFRAGQSAGPAARTSIALPRTAVPALVLPVATAPHAILPAADARPVVSAPALRRDPRGARHGTDDPPSRAGGSLAIELRAVRNAERALRDGSPGLALAFLNDLDRQVPHGELAEEREATATLARCARREQPFDVNLGDEFTTRHPTSVYRARVEQACARTDGGPSGDSPRRRSGP